MKKRSGVERQRERDERRRLLSREDGLLSSDS